jgi:hypothetical protein
MSDFQDGYYCFTDFDTALIEIEMIDIYYYKNVLLKLKDRIFYIAADLETREYRISIVGIWGFWMSEQMFIKCLLPYIRKLSDIELVIKDIIE